MGDIFAASEVVELGIQIEKNGRDFYGVLAKLARAEKAGNIFKYLAAEEEKHILVFQKLLSGLEKYEPPQIYADDYVAYMKALAGEYIFTQPEKGKELAQKTKNDKEAVDLGIKFEEDSIVFYEGMKKVVPDFDIKTVEQLILQEQEHLKKLVGLKASL
jgi:rubrerythrin